MDILREYLNSGNEEIFEPEYFRLQNKDDKKDFEDLLKRDISFFVYDEIDSQLRELVKCLNPQMRIRDEDYPALVAKHLNGRNADEYGVWIYYPWSHKIVHSLDEEEFIEVRTNRNKYKLTTEEQKYLAGKKIGIIGLSVGQSIALTIAMERICGELRLTDFDTAELSNLNRIRTGLHNLGLKKTVIAAREIAEIDPFLKVKIFSEGLQKENIDAFFTGSGKLDLLVEVCDGLDIKILSRFRARALGIPVVMDTNDRGMMDIERFDLEPDRPILHGLAGDLNPDNIKDLSNEQKIPYIFKMVGIDTLSTRLKASMLEVSQSINTWPQLASSVVLGGALTTDVARRILLDQYHDSGRYYIDIDQLIADKEEKHGVGGKEADNITGKEMEEIALQYFEHNPHIYEAVSPELTDILAEMSPSSREHIKYFSYYSSRGILFVFSNSNNSSWDKTSIGAHIALGEAFERIHIEAHKLGLQDHITIDPVAAAQNLAAIITFKKIETIDFELIALAKKRDLLAGNNNFIKTQPLPFDFLENLQYFVKSGEEIQVLYTQKTEDIDTLAGIVGASQRLQLLDEDGHSDFYKHISWNGEGHGTNARELGFTDAEIGGYSVARDWQATKLLSTWNKGNAFKLMAAHKASLASAMMLMVVRGNSKTSVIAAGRALEKVYLYCNSEGVSVQAYITPTILVNKSMKGDYQTIPDKEKEINNIKDNLFKTFGLNNKEEGDTQVFLMKLALPAKGE